MILFLHHPPYREDVTIRGQLRLRGDRVKPEASLNGGAPRSGAQAVRRGAVACSADGLGNEARGLDTLSDDEEE